MRDSQTYHSLLFSRGSALFFTYTEHVLSYAIWFISVPDNGSCAQGTHDCDTNAICSSYNTLGHVCYCKTNYYGNGTAGNCKGIF